MSPRLVSFVLALTLLGACRQSVDVATASPEGPQAEVPTYVRFQLTKPLYDAAQPLPKFAPPKVTVTPNVPVRATISSPYTVDVEFGVALAPAQAYEVTLAPGLVSADGKLELKTGRTVRFSTPRNGLHELGSHDASGREVEGAFVGADGRLTGAVEGLGPTETLELAFRYPVADAQLGLVKVFVRDGVAQPVDVRRDASAPEKVVVSPKGRWPRDADLVVSIDAGLKVDLPNAGPLATEKPLAYDVRTWGALRVVSGPDASAGCVSSKTVAVQFSNPVACASTLGQLSVDVPGTAIKCVSELTSRGQRYELTPPPPSDKPVTLTILGGLHDAFGETSDEAATYHFTPCAPDVQFAYVKPFAILDPGQDAQDVERVHGAASVKVEGKRLGVAEVWKVLSEEKLTDQVAWTELPWWMQDGEDADFWGDGEGDGGGQSRKPGELSGAKVPELDGAASVTVPVPEGDGWQDVSFGLEQFLGGKKGLVLLRETPLGADGNVSGRAVVRLANVTDLGLSARMSQKTLVVLAASYQTGKPVAGVKIALRTEQGEALGEATTDATGLARLAISDAGAHGLGDLRLLVVATKGDDEAFLWSRFVSDAHDASNGPELVGLVYPDRGIYRPGEKGHLRGVVRLGSADGLDSLAGTKARLTIQAPDDASFVSEDVTLDAWGAFEKEVDFPADAKVGEYDATLAVGGSSLRASFQVGEFRRAEMKVEVQAPPKLTWGKPLEAVVQGEYLFGAPTSGLDLDWSLSRQARAFRSQRFPDAAFTDPTREEWSWQEPSPTLLASGSATLDDKGSFVVRQPLKLPNPVSQREQVALSATVQDKNGQSVSRLATMDLFTADVVVGVESTSYLSAMTDPVHVTAVTVTPDDALAPNTKVRVLSRLSGWRSIRREGPGGGYYWTSERVDEPETERCSGVTNASGAFECSFTPDAGGDMQLIAEATDASGRTVRSATWHWIYGDTKWWGESSDTPKVGVLFDHDAVDAGKSVKVAITSPYKDGVALVTVEREDILWQKSFPIGSSATIDLPTSLAWAPDVDVTATVVRGRVTPVAGQTPDPEKDKPQYAIGHKILKVRPKGETLKVNVQVASQRLEPGQRQTAKVTVTRDDRTPAANAEVNLWAVDEGVLMLTGYDTPDLVSSMFAERDRRTLGLDTRAYVLGKRTFVEPVIKGQEDGGGGGHANDDELRRDFNPLAVWIGNAVTDANGQVVETFQVPDSLTTYKVMAVADEQDSHFGQGDGEFKVNKPLMLRNAMSRFARPGDTFDAGVLVNQLTDSAGVATVALEQIDEKLFTVTGPRSQQVSVKPGETVPVLFHLAANDVEGTSHIVFSATLGDHHDRVQLDLPVVRRTPREAVSLSGVVASGKFDGALKLPPMARAETVEVNVSGFPISAMEGRLREMVGYPYGCLEQKTSKILPLLAIRDLAQSLDMKSIPTDQIKGWVDEYVSIIPRYRCADDGFDYWPGCHYGSSTVLSSFALEGMLTAKKYGFQVQQSEIDRTVAYLRKMVRAGDKGHDEYGGDGLEDHDFVGALRVLAEAGTPEPEIEKARFDARAGMPLFAKTDLARAMAYHLGSGAAKDASVQTLLTEIGQAGKSVGGTLTFDADNPQRYWWEWDSEQRNTALVLRTLLQIEPADGRVPLLVKGLLDLDRASPYYISSDVTQTLLGLSDAVRAEKMNGNAKPAATVSVGGQSLGSAELGSKVKTFSVPAGNLGAEIPVDVANTGSAPVFFGAFLNYGYPATARLPAASNGFTLTREYVGQDGRPLPVTQTDHGPVLKLTAGEFVKVNVHVDVGGEGRLVLIEDPLAAGLEPVDTSLKTTDTAAVQRMGGDEARNWWDRPDRALHDDRVEWHYQHVWSRRLDLTYLARATTAGTFYAPGAHAERMYQPAINGRSDGLVIQVAPKGE